MGLNCSDFFYTRYRIQELELKYKGNTRQNSIRRPVKIKENVCHIVQSAESFLIFFKFRFVEKNVKKSKNF